MSHADLKNERVGIAIWLSNKVDLNSKGIIGDKEGHFLIIKELIHQEDMCMQLITFFKIHFLKKELKEEINSVTNTVTFLTS